MSHDPPKLSHYVSSLVTFLHLELLHRHLPKLFQTQNKYHLYRRGICTVPSFLAEEAKPQGQPPLTLSHIGAGHVGSEVGQGGCSETTMHLQRASTVCSHCSECRALVWRTLSGTAPWSLGPGNQCHQADAPALCCAVPTALLWSVENCV